MPLVENREAMALSCFFVDAGKLETGLKVTAESELCRDIDGVLCF